MMTTHPHGGLRVDSLQRTFGEVTALSDVSFTVKPGILTGFVGGNGAGKTTTMRIIMGVLAASAGSVIWNGAPITVNDQRRFGYMPEERGLFPKQPILAQLEYLCALKGVEPHTSRPMLTELLERFGLGDRLKSPLEKLSLGNQQRVQIIAAVASHPTCLILDEPFSGLDPDAVDAMCDLLREHAARGIPVLFSSHQLDLVERLCDELVILANGRVVLHGTSAQMRADATASHRLVTSGDAGWVRTHPDVITLDVDGPSAIIDFTDPAAKHSLLTEALRRGDVYEFGPIIPTLSEIYREITS